MTFVNKIGDLVVEYSRIYLQWQVRNVETNCTWRFDSWQEAARQAQVMWDDHVANEAYREQQIAEEGER